MKSATLLQAQVNCHGCLIERRTLKRAWQWWCHCILPPGS